jgi:hypothetical protein
MRLHQAGNMDWLFVAIGQVNGSGLHSIGGIHGRSFQKRWQ